MPFQKGKTGNPRGQIRDKLWYSALHRGLKERDPETKRQRLELVADAVIEAAIAGDIQAAKEIGDRMDGKSAPSPEEREDVKRLLQAVINVGIAAKP